MARKKTTPCYHGFHGASPAPTEGHPRCQYCDSYAVYRYRVKGSRHLCGGVLACETHRINAARGTGWAPTVLPPASPEVVKTHDQFGYGW